MANLPLSQRCIQRDAKTQHHAVQHLGVNFRSAASPTPSGEMNYVSRAAAMGSTVVLPPLRQDPFAALFSAPCDVCGPLGMFIAFDLHHDEDSWHVCNLPH
ncbi:MAG: hypothetical protein KDA41_23080 [Planctomycetales bacterium]|nr:hypothetical protein [Planctomycetales bacterium]